MGSGHSRSRTPRATGPACNALGWEGGAGALSRKTGLRIGHAHAIWAEDRTDHLRPLGRLSQAIMDLISTHAMDGMPPRVLAACLGAALVTMTTVADEPRCASTVVGYTAGSGAGAAYRNPASALGPPTQFTGLGVEPGAVTPFRPAFMPSEIVSIGRGGELVIAFDEPVTDDAAHPFGIDLIVYGNAMCGDIAYPSGVAGWVFQEGGSIDVSIDGVTWLPVPGAEADGGLPTLGWTDVSPYSTVAGTMPTDPALPIDPQVNAESIAGLSWPELLTVYGNAAGGTGIDLADVGIASIRFIRIRVAIDAASVPEIDAVVAVRAPRAPADFNSDGRVDGSDLGVLLGAWGICSDCWADMDHDGEVGGSDLGILLGMWS